jgi:hypothetical protein
MMRDVQGFKIKGARSVFSSAKQGCIEIPNHLGFFVMSCQHLIIGLKLGYEIFLFPIPSMRVIQLCICIATSELINP